MAARLRPSPDEPRTRLKQASLWSPTRLSILEAVHAEPGLSVADVARRIERDPSTVWNHLHLLRAATLIRTERDGRQLRVYPANGLSERQPFAARLGASRPVFDAIAGGVPGRPVPIAHACGITRHAARYHLDRLARLGVIKRTERRVLVTQRIYSLSADPMA